MAVEGQRLFGFWDSVLWLFIRTKGPKTNNTNTSAGARVLISDCMVCELDILGFSPLAVTRRGRGKICMLAMELVQAVASSQQVVAPSFEPSFQW